MIFMLEKFGVAIKFLGVYLYQLITSSISTINYILFKTKDMNPGLLSYETRLTSDWAITFLTILIIITPGSTVIRISQDSKKFFIHSIDVSEKEKDSSLRNIKHYEEMNIGGVAMIQTITHIMIISSLIIFGIALIICLFRLIKDLQQQIVSLHLIQQVLS